MEGKAGGHVGGLFGEMQSGEGSGGVSGNVGIVGEMHGHAAGYSCVVGRGLEKGGELVVGLNWLGKKVKAG